MNENPYSYESELEPKSELLEAIFGFLHFFSLELATILARPFCDIIIGLDRKINIIDSNGNYKRFLILTLSFTYLAIAASAVIGMFALIVLFVQIGEKLI